MQSDGIDVSVKWVRSVVLIRRRSQDRMTSARSLAAADLVPVWKTIVQHRIAVTYEGQHTLLWVKRLSEVFCMLSLSLCSYYIRPSLYF